MIKVLQNLRVHLPLSGSIKNQSQGSGWQKPCPVQFSYTYRTTVTYYCLPNLLQEMKKLRGKLQGRECYLRYSPI